MLTEGTTSRDALALALELDTLGTNLSAGASLDTATIAMDTLTTNLAPSLKIFADVVMNPAFKQADIDRRRGLWMETIKREKASPQSQALRILPGLMFSDDHAYNAPLTGSGTEASISRLTRDDLVQHHATWVRPDNARLVIVGATTEAQIKPLLEQALVAWNAPATAKPVKQFPTVTPPTKARVFLIDQPGSPQAMIIAGQFAPSSDVPEAEAFDVMNTIIGGSFTSRINMNLREDKGWSYGARTSWFGADAAGLLLAVAPVQADKAKESVQELLARIQWLHGRQPSYGR